MNVPMCPPRPLRVPMPSGYRELEHGHGDRSTAEAVWSYLSVANGHHLVLPDGRADLIIRFAWSESGAIRDVEPVLSGPTARPARVPLRPRLGSVGIRFRPGVAGPVLGAPVSALAGRRLSGRGVSALIPGLEALISPVGTVDELVDQLARFAASRRPVSPPEPVAAALDLMHLEAGRVRVGDLCRLLQVSERALHRAFTVAVGLPPKLFASILRFHRAVRLLQAGMTPADAALEAGYADQAHLTRTCRRLGGFTPATLPRMPLPDLPL